MSACLRFGDVRWNLPRVGPGIEDTGNADLPTDVGVSDIVGADHSRFGWVVYRADILLLPQAPIDRNAT